MRVLRLLCYGADIAHVVGGLPAGGCGGALARAQKETAKGRSRKTVRSYRRVTLANETGSRSRSDARKDALERIQRI
eukprot:scaffold37640_cov83-Cyclotella_meneghiniana.AAC.4